MLLKAVAVIALGATHLLLAAVFTDSTDRAEPVGCVKPLNSE
jgi:hypothetical protein